MQRRATRLVRNSTGTICAANTAGSGAQATRLAPRVQLTARIAVNQSKQRSHATYLNHTRRVSWQVAQAQTTQTRLSFRADIGEKFSGFWLVISFFLSFLSCGRLLVYACGRLFWRSSFLACCLRVRSQQQPRLHSYRHCCFFEDSLPWHLNIIDWDFLAVLLPWLCFVGRSYWLRLNGWELLA